MDEDLEFPLNFAKILRDRFEDQDEFSMVVARPLRPSDQDRMVGIFPTVWIPQEFEIGQYDPAVTRYMLAIQTMAKNATEEEGIAAHSKLAKKVRVMLYRDEDLRVQLGRLKTTDPVVTERVQRWGATNQRFLANEINGQFLFLAVTDLWLETEII